MLVNYLYMFLGYPPIIVPTDEKAAYLVALRLADAGDSEPLASYLGRRLEVSLLLGIKAGKGESVEESGDIEKEIALFVRSQEHHRKKVQPKSIQAIRNLYESGLKDLIDRSIKKMHSFDPLFLSSKTVADPHGSGGDNDPLGSFEKQLAQGFKNPKHFGVIFHFQGYRGEAKTQFGVQTTLQMNFDTSDYKISVANKTLVRKLYTEPLLSDERDRVIQHMLESVLNEIKQKSK
jgi:hypothetical protein